MIHSTMPVTRRVVSAAARILAQFRRRWIAETTIAPKVPMPAASTGVAIPAKITPSTRVTRVMGASMFSSKRIFSRVSTRSATGRAGPSAGFSPQRAAT